jgi:hypothetical protein
LRFSVALLHTPGLVIYVVLEAARVDKLILEAACVDGRSELVDRETLNAVVGNIVARQRSRYRATRYLTIRVALVMNVILVVMNLVQVNSVIMTDTLHVKCCVLTESIIVYVAAQQNR